MEKFDVIILGAGAAGLFCAMRAGQLGSKVLLIDRADQVGSKILISGGGRCNFTNLEISSEKYISQNKHFCLSALKSYTQHDFIKLVEKHGIRYHEKTLGQLFCDRSAQEIIDMLVAECQIGGVDIRLSRHILDVKHAVNFLVQTQEEVLEAPALVLATGGLSIPKMGATGLSYELAKQFGLPLTEIKAGLVPLIFEGSTLEFMRELAGVSLPVIATAGRQSFRESMIFTHKGISGPAILQASSYWQEGSGIALNLLPDTDVESFLIERKHARSKAELKTILSEVLPQRLAYSIVTHLFRNAPVGTFADKELKLLARLLNNWELTPAGSEGYAKAEVTLGGISTHALSSKTMQSVDVKGLYVIGEAVDVTGWLGGYNFQWAWSSGWAAGSAIGASELI